MADYNARFAKAPYRTFDKLRRVTETAVLENKRR